MFFSLGYINLEEKNSTQPKTLARIELNESVNQGQTDNKAGPPADHIKDQASNVQPQSECIEKDITKKDGSPGHKGICYGIAACNSFEHYF